MFFFRLFFLSFYLSIWVVKKNPVTRVATQELNFQAVAGPPAGLSILPIIHQDLKDRL